MNVVYGRGFLASLRANAVAPASLEGKQLRATLRALETAAVLPTDADGRTIIPPSGRAWFRRIVGANLWVLFRVSTADVFVLAVVREPPYPAD